MKVGDLFVDLGIKGSDKTIGAIGATRGALKETASVSLEAKAAIVGAMYALQKLFSTSSQAGTDLRNFNELIGVSAQTLQQYQYAARQVGVGNQEMENTFKGLQSTMTKTLMGEGAPKGLARVAMLTGQITPEDIKKFAEQPQLLIQRLQQYSQKETNAGLRNEVLKSFGVSEGVAAAMRRNAFRPEVLNKAPTYSDSEIKKLDKANAAWSNLSNKIEMAFGRFNAKHGEGLVKDLSKMVDKVIELAEAFATLAEKTKLFERIGSVFEGWTHIFDALTSAVSALAVAMEEADKPENQGKGKVEYAMETMPNIFGAMLGGFTGGKPLTTQQLRDEADQNRKLKLLDGGKGKEEKPAKTVGEKIETSMMNFGTAGIANKIGDALWGKIDGSIIRTTPGERIGGKVDYGNLRSLFKTPPELPTQKPSNLVARPQQQQGPPAAAANAVPGKTEFNQTQNFYGDQNPQDVGKAAQKGVTGAYRQMHGQAQGS